MSQEQIPSPLDFLLSRLDDVAPERYPAHSVRIICAAAMEEFASLKTKALEQSNKELLEALRKIQDFDEYSEYEDPGQIAKEAIERSTNFKKPCPVSLRPAG